MAAAQVRAPYHSRLDGTCTLSVVDRLFGDPFYIETYTAASALVAVAAAEGAGHIVPRRNLPYHASPLCCSRYC